MSDGIEVRPEDAMQVAQKALQKVNELEEDLDQLRQQHEHATEDLAALKLRVSEINEDRDYDDLSIDEKVGLVREHAFEKASRGHGRANLDYNDIKWAVFDGEPGNNHCYKLMRRAAGEEEEEQKDMNAGAVGFIVRNPANENQHLAVDAELAKRSAEFYSRNKTDSGEVASE
jgi:DNA-binding protein H-NS